MKYRRHSFTHAVGHGVTQEQWDRVFEPEPKPMVPVEENGEDDSADNTPPALDQADGFAGMSVGWEEYT